MEVESSIPLLESTLHEWRETIGGQYEPYRDHVYRVVNFCFSLHQCEQNDKEKIIIAGCFHDLE